MTDPHPAVTAPTMASDLPVKISTKSLHKLFVASIVIFIVSVITIIGAVAFIVYGGVAHAFTYYNGTHSDLGGGVNRGEAFVFTQDPFAGVALMGTCLSFIISAMGMLLVAQRRAPGALMLSALAVALSTASVLGVVLVIIALGSVL